MGAKGKLAVIAGGVALVIGSAAIAYFAAPKPPPQRITTPSPVITIPDAPLPAAPLLVAPDVAPPPVLATPAPPQFDVVRMEKDGSTLIAGMAAPHARVSVMLDTQVAAVVDADAAGGFAALLTLPPAMSPRWLSLRMRLADGRDIASVEQVVLSSQDILPEVAVAAAPPPFAPPTTAPPTTADPAVDIAPTAPKAEPATVVAVLPAIAADSAPAAFLIGPEGVRAMQNGPAAPEGGVTAVVIDAISYTGAGGVQLGGRGMAGATVRVYLDTLYLAEFPVAADGGWGGGLPDVPPGLHTLRADQIDAAARVTARFSTPFQRETPAALAALSVAVQPPQPAAPRVLSQPAVKPLAPPAAPAAPKIAIATPSLVTGALVTWAVETGAVETGAVKMGAVSDAVPVAPVTITVQPGLTLWAIAQDQFGDGVRYIQVYEANRDRIRDPDLIYPGQVFALPQPTP